MDRWIFEAIINMAVRNVIMYRKTKLDEEYGSRDNYFRKTKNQNEFLVTYYCAFDLKWAQLVLFLLLLFLFSEKLKVISAPFSNKNCPFFFKLCKKTFIISIESLNSFSEAFQMASIRFGDRF